MKYVKKPIVIEAIQMTKANMEHETSWPDWLRAAYDAGDLRKQAGKNPSDRTCLFMTIKTLEGIHVADVNDWIIKGIKDELYPCKPDIFEATYDEVTP